MILDRSLPHDKGIIVTSKSPPRRENAGQDWQIGIYAIELLVLLQLVKVLK